MLIASQKDAIAQKRKSIYELQNEILVLEASLRELERSQSGTSNTEAKRAPGPKNAAAVQGNRAESIKTGYKRKWNNLSDEPAYEK